METIKTDTSIPKINLERCPKCTEFAPSCMLNKPYQFDKLHKATDFIVMQNETTCDMKITDQVGNTFAKNIKSAYGIFVVHNNKLYFHCLGQCTYALTTCPTGQCISPEKIFDCNSFCSLQSKMPNARENIIYTNYSNNMLTTTFTDKNMKPIKKFVGYDVHCQCHPDIIILKKQDMFSYYDIKNMRFIIKDTTNFIGWENGMIKEYDNSTKKIKLLKFDTSSNRRVSKF